jgi:hypothetical protein
MWFFQMREYFRRIHPLTLGVFLVIPALLSCSVSPAPEEPPVPISTPTLAPEDGPVLSLLDSSDEILTECIFGEVVIHIHVRLTITVEDRPLLIPPGVGITPECTHPLHTHNDSGVIHVEHTRLEEFTLGDFFVIGERWGDFDPLAGMQVVRVWVDGGRYSSEYWTLPLTEGLDIRLDLVRLTVA